MLATTKQAPDHFALIGKMVHYAEVITDKHGNYLRTIKHHCKVEKICPSPYWGDNTLRAFVVDYASNWSDYPFASYVQFLLGGV